MHEAASRGREATALAFIEQDNANGKYLLAHQNEWGNTPLHEACQSGLLQVVKRLLEVCGDKLLRVRNEIGDTPLDHAVEHGSDAVVEYLRGIGAKSGHQVETDIVICEPVH